MLTAGEAVVPRMNGLLWSRLVPSCYPPFSCWVRHHHGCPMPPSADHLLWQLRIQKPVPAAAGVPRKTLPKAVGDYRGNGPRLWGLRDSSP
ncbi:LRRN4 C-terminal-like protein isoform X2 [Malaclemys terrapin pileata]|uniref:LRRN4 C-terminal-like protein isoform X2 n=1 Tax=Malaclemys terrapin pileata TaxID=2991368 RepID=UPI0023A90008|nr:LRRN4 C-terminal-like protein isoform X2 [Malaclemys terrapin pileata]